MASTLTMKKLLTSNLLSNSRRPAAAASCATASRFFTTDYISDDDRCFHAGSNFYSNYVFTRRSSIPKVNPLSQILLWPVLSGGSGGCLSRYTVKDDGVHIRFEMPGLGKEDVRVYVESISLVIKGEKKCEDEEVIKYSSRINVDEKMYNIKEMKAEMKNGVLKVFLPRLKEEERSDVLHE